MRMPRHLGLQRGGAVRAQPARQLFRDALAGRRRAFFISRNSRDLAMWVHQDVLFQAYFNACLILITPPNDDPTAGGIGCLLNPSNPVVFTE